MFDRYPNCVILESLGDDRMHGEYIERTCRNQRAAAKSEETITRVTVTRWYRSCKLFVTLIVTHNVPMAA